MFDDARSKKVVLAAHCLLNQCAISDGTAECASQFTAVVELLMEHGIGILQLPCPELLCLGLERGDAGGARRPLLDENSRIRTQMLSEAAVGILRRQAVTIARQVVDYRSHGFEVIGIVGVDRSPSCGVDTTSRDGREELGRGVFVEILADVLAQHGTVLRMVGTKTSEPERSIERVRRFLDEVGRPASRSGPDAGGRD